MEAPANCHLSIVDVFGLIFCLSTESADLELGPLALLHQQARDSVFRDLRKMVGDRMALSALQCLVGFGAVSGRHKVHLRYTGSSANNLTSCRVSHTV